MNRKAIIGVLALAGAGYWWWMQRNSNVPAEGGLYGGEGYTGGGYIGGQGGGWGGDVLWDEGGGLGGGIYGGEGSDDLQGMSSDDDLIDDDYYLPVSEEENGGGLGGGTSKDVDTLARTLWGEARGEVRNYGIRSLQAVANSVVNRVKKNSWWGKTISTVCRYPSQFTCWNETDPNRKQLLAVTKADAIFVMCLHVAQKAAAGMLPDITGGATHYHTLTTHPDWAKAPGATVTLKIGNHIFYKGVK